MSKTRIVNMRHEECDVRIDRTTKFGNPYRITYTSTRAKAIAAYRRHFHNRVCNDPRFFEAVLGLRGKRLGCWCKPGACHGDVIVEWLEEHAES